MKYTALLTELQTDGFQNYPVKGWRQNFTFAVMACGIITIAQMRYTVQFSVVLDSHVLKRKKNKLVKF